MGGATMDHYPTAGLKGDGDLADTSTSLLQRLRARDPQAWQRVLDLYGPLVYAWCRRSGLRAQDAGDVLQEVFVAVFAGIDRFRHDRAGDTLRGWLRTIVRSKICDNVRRQAGRAEAVGGTEAARRMAEVREDELDLGDDSADRSELCRRVMSLIRTDFETTTWQAFWLVTVEDRPPSIVAGELGLSPGAVRQAKYRVLRRLREELEAANG